MDPNTPLTTGYFIQAMWALMIGMVAPWLTIIPAWRLIERWRERCCTRGRPFHPCPSRPGRAATSGEPRLGRYDARARAVHHDL
jgi:hypothetical protein